MANILLVSLIAIVLIIKARNAQEQYVLAATDRCFDSRAYTTGYAFNPPHDGEIIGVKLVHKSGLVDCNFNVYPNTNGLTYWGCQGRSWIFIEMILHDVTGITYYPTATTEGISGLVPLGCAIDEASWGCSVQYYWISGYDGRTSPYIELRDSANPYVVSTRHRFSLQYGEGCCDVARPDNAGTSCADVYFIYSNIYTDDPTGKPTSSPSKKPTMDTSTPTQTPTKNPSQTPTVYPTLSPTNRPTLFPIVIPSNGPTKSPVNAPTSFPTAIPSNVPTLSPTDNPIADVAVVSESTGIMNTNNKDESEESAKSNDLFGNITNGEGMTMIWIFIGIGVLVLLLVVIIVCYCCVKRKKMHEELSDEYDDW
eukprot:215990_1